MSEIEILRDLNGQKEIAVDYQFIDDVLAGRALDSDQYPLQQIYNRLSSMEAAVSGMEGGKPVMHIGTGWPGTAVGLYRQFGIPVTCVERDEDFAQKSYDGLKKLNLIGDDKLQVVCADGAELNPEGFRVVTVSAMVPNVDKARIIQNLRQLATDSLSDPLLILRNPTATGFLLYQELDRAILNGYWLEKIGDTQPLVGPNDPLISYVFRVSAMAEVRRGSDRILLAAANRLRRPVHLAA